MKRKVTFTLTITEAIKIDYALMLASDDFLKRGQKGYALEMETIRQHLAKQTPSRSNKEMMHDALNGRR